MSANVEKQALNARQVSQDVSGHPDVLRRLQSLKKLQLERLAIEGQLDRQEFIQMITKYQSEFQKLEQKRRMIITGDIEPTDQDCLLDGLESSMKGLSIKEVPQKETVNSETAANVRGIPGFWLKALQSLDEIYDWIEPTDEDLLFHLADIEVTFGGLLDSTPARVVLTFRFNPNDYFSNETLTKSYDIEFGPNPRSPWDLKRYHPIGRKGCHIEWKNGKNVTQKTSKDKKSREKVNSFFDFFDDSKLKSPSKEDKNAEEIEDHLLDDWCLADLLIEKVVPFAVLCYTGDINGSESSGSSDEDSYDDDDSHTDSHDD